MFSYSVIEVLLSVVGHIAANGSDYVGQSNVLLTFNADTTRLNASVELIDDNTYEREEDFKGILTLVSTSPRVSIVTDTAVVTIEDDEGMQNCLFRISWTIYKAMPPV